MKNLKVWFSLLSVVLVLSFSLTIFSGKLKFHPQKRFDPVSEEGNASDDPVSEEGNASNASIKPPDTRTCVLPEGGRFHSWEGNRVTKLKPEIKIDCQKLFDGNMSEVGRLEATRIHWNNSFKNNDLLEATANCSFVKEYFNNNLYTTRLESSFPIAFVFVIYNSPQQVVRLLRLLYRPHNQYCIHPDLKSGPNFSSIFRNIAGCLDNVHIASEVRAVKWGHKSIMESLMGCYKDLMEIRKKQHDQRKWNYVINLCGKELPLKTNHEIVSLLLALNRTSIVEGNLTKSNDPSYTRLWKKKPIPHSIPYARSSVYMALTPYFINFLFTNSTAVDLYEYFKNCLIPEEHYFATVYMMPNVPGGFNPNLSKNSSIHVDRYLWDHRHYKKYYRTICHGNVVHYVCIVDIGDLHWLIKKPEFEHALFQNKYFMEDDHLVMDCMEERIVAQNKLEYKLDCHTSAEVTDPVKILSHIDT